MNKCLRKKSVRKAPGGAVGAPPPAPTQPVAAPPRAPVAAAVPAPVAAPAPAPARTPVAVESDSSSDDELTAEGVIEELEDWLKELKGQGQQRESGARWERFVAFFLRWIYKPPSSTDAVMEVNRSFSSYYSEVKWTGGPYDRGKDITCIQVSPSVQVIVQCKRSNDTVEHHFLKSELEDKVKRVSRSTNFTTGIAAVYPKIRNRAEVFNILQEINDGLRDEKKFILLEEWNVTPKSPYNIKNRLNDALEANQHLLEFFYTRLKEGFPVGSDQQPLPFQARKKGKKRRRG